MQNDLTCRAILLCEKTSIQPVTGGLSIVNVIPEIALKLSPQGMTQVGDTPHFTNIPLEVVVYFSRSTSEGDLTREFTLELLDASGLVLIKDAKGLIQMKGGHLKFFSLIKFEKGIPCTRPGEYVFRVLLNGESISMYEEHFDVKMFDQDGKQL